MRAVYFKEFKNEVNSDVITLKGDKAHHLQKVVRVKLVKIS